MHEQCSAGIHVMFLEGGNHCGQHTMGPSLSFPNHMKFLLGRILLKFTLDEIFIVF